MTPRTQHRTLRPERDRAFDAAVIVIASVLMLIALWMEISDQKDRSNAAQMAPAETHLPAERLTLDEGTRTLTQHHD